MNLWRSTNILIVLGWAVGSKFNLLLSSALSSVDSMCEDKLDFYSLHSFSFFLTNVNPAPASSVFFFFFFFGQVEGPTQKTMDMGGGEVCGSPHNLL